MIFNCRQAAFCVLLFIVISWRYHLTPSARMVVGLSQLPARRRGTHCQKLTHLRRVENGTAAFGRLLKTHLFSEYWRIQRIRGFGDNALYKSTFYLLTYGCRTDDFKD